MKNKKLPFMLPIKSLVNWGKEGNTQFFLLLNLCGLTPWNRSAISSSPMPRWSLAGDKLI